MRDLPPISFVAIRFLIATAVLFAVSLGRVRLLPLRRSDYATLAFTGILMFGLMAYRLLPVSDLPNVDFPTITVTTLQPGQYSALVRGKPEGTGIGVVQVYFLQ